jgi:hypothetical protein
MLSRSKLADGSCEDGWCIHKGFLRSKGLVGGNVIGAGVIADGRKGDVAYIDGLTD